MVLDRTCEGDISINTCKFICNVQSLIRCLKVKLIISKVRKVTINQMFCVCS